MEFKVRIRAVRIEKGYTQKGLAEAAGISTRQYQSLELGKYKPGFETLIALADALQVSLDYLMCRTDVNTPPN